MWGAVGLVDVLVVSGTSTLCSDVSCWLVVVTLGKDDGRFVTMVSSLWEYPLVAEYGHD